jgi:hypothetical protein
MTLVVFVIHLVSILRNLTNIVFLAIMIIWHVVESPDIKTLKGAAMHLCAVPHESITSLPTRWSGATPPTEPLVKRRVYELKWRKAPRPGDVVLEDGKTTELTVVFKDGLSYAQSVTPNYADGVVIVVTRPIKPRSILSRIFHYSTSVVETIPLPART